MSPINDNSQDLLHEMIPNGPHLSAKDFREVMSIGHTRLKQLIDQGHLKAIRVGRLIRIPRTEARRFIGAVMRGETVIEPNSREEWLELERAQSKKRKDAAFEGA